MNGPSDSPAAKADEGLPGAAGQVLRTTPPGEPTGHDKSLPELPSANIADVPRLAPSVSPVYPAHTGTAPVAATAPTVAPQTTAPATQPANAAATNTPAPSNPTPAIPIPQLRRLDGLTIGALPTRKPSSPPTQASTAPSAPGGLSFGSVDDRPAPPPHEKAAAQFGTPLMAEPPLPAAKRSTLPQTPSASSNALDDLVRTIGTLTEDRAAPGIDQPRSQRVELDFYAILPEVVSAIEDVRQPLERIGIEIGPQGQPTWSARNVAYGTLQRIEMNGSVLAWLICEMEHRGALVVRVVPERADDVAITGSARRERGPYQRPDIANAAAEALKPLAAYAAVVVPRRGQALNAAQVSQEAQWAEVEPVAREALVAANEALTSVAAQLEPMAQAAFDNASMRMRWPVTVEVGGAIVALMHVERSDDWLDVAITPSDSHRADLVRRARTVATGVTPQSLAEVMAEAVWPVIVAARTGATSNN